LPQFLQSCSIFLLALFIQSKVKLSHSHLDE